MMTRLIVTGTLTAAALFAAPRVVQYSAEIGSAGGYTYTVDIQITTGDEAWLRPFHTLVGFDGVRLRDLSVHTAAGPGLPSRVEPAGVLQRLIIEAAMAPHTTYDVHYLVEGSVTSPVHIPLAVPEIASFGSPRSITIAVVPPQGYIIAGDTFPALARNGAGVETAELANIPNHVRFEIGRGGERSFRQRWLTPFALSDFAVAGLLAAGSIARVVIKKMGG
jgi:hypothetical protein